VCSWLEEMRKWFDLNLRLSVQLNLTGAIVKGEEVLLHTR